MIRVSDNDFSNYISWAMNCSSNQVYPLSITEGIQSGDIYVDDPENPGMVLFWHYCGFAYISGVTSGKILEEAEFRKNGEQRYYDDLIADKTAERGNIALWA